MSQPEFSVVIPTYERPEPLEICLTALSELDYPRDHFEVIVVNDGGISPLEKPAAAYAAKLNLRMAIQNHAGPAAARNYGASLARFRYVAFTDDDCSPLPGWLKALAIHFEALPDHGIGGKTLNGLTANYCSSASQLLIDYLYAYYNSEDAGQARFFASNNLAFPVKTFLDIGGFNTSFRRAAGEDRELCDRWLQHGFKLTYAPDVQVMHRHPLSVRKFWLQHFNYGRGARCFHELKAERKQQPIRIEPLPFYLNLIGYPSRNRGTLSAALLAGFMGLSQIANACGFFYESFTGRNRK